MFKGIIIYLRAFVFMCVFYVFCIFSKIFTSVLECQPSGVRKKTRPADCHFLLIVELEDKLNPVPVRK